MELSKTLLNHLQNGAKYFNFLRRVLKSFQNTPPQHTHTASKRNLIHGQEVDRVMDFSASP